MGQSPNSGQLVVARVFEFFGRKWYAIGKCMGVKVRPIDVPIYIPSFLYMIALILKQQGSDETEIPNIAKRRARLGSFGNFDSSQNNLMFVK